ncbi:MAG TPA: hypothetical protein VM344_04595 [Vitreimonas sp.]|nr:hypothetical protein [Vitreimonas sp.]
MSMYRDRRTRGESDDAAKGGDAMDTSRNDLLGELAADAALERSDFLVQATEQLNRFLDANRQRIADMGGLTLIDEDPDYLSIAPDLTFRSRTRYQDELSGAWVSDTEVIESAGELVELYNPADLYQAFADAAREAAGLASGPTAADDLMTEANVGPDETFVGAAGDPYAAVADEWAATQPETPDADTEEGAAQRLYDLALEYQERSQRSEARLLDDFAVAAENLTSRLGDLIVVDDDDERLTLTASDGFRAEVVPEDADGEWRTLETADELVEFYDPTDVFGDLADALAEAWPAVVPDAELGTTADDLDGDEAGLDDEPADAELAAEADAAEDDDSRNGNGATPRG